MRACLARVDVPECGWVQVCGGGYTLSARPGKFAKHDRERRIGELQEKCTPSTTEIGNVERSALVPRNVVLPFPGGKELSTAG